MAIERMKVRVAFSSLFCHEEADGAGSAEPYLWVFYFKIDGSAATLDLNARNQLFLRGTSINIGSPGSLGNLGTTDVDPEDDVVLPPTIRSHGAPLLLEPITLSPAARARHPDLEAVGGLIGFVAALMENDDVSGADAQTAHREFNRSIRDTVKDAIDAFVVPSVIERPTADDIMTLFRDQLGPRIVELVEERRNEWATFPNYQGDGRDDKVGMHTAFFVHQAFAGGKTFQADHLFNNPNHGQFTLHGRALGSRPFPIPRSRSSAPSRSVGGNHESHSGAAIQTTADIVYRDGHGHILNLFRDTTGQPSVVDLSTSAAPQRRLAIPSPMWNRRTASSSCSLAAQTIGHVHSIYWGQSKSIFGHEDLTTLAGLGTPDAAATRSATSIAATSTT